LATDMLESQSRAQKTRILA